MKKACNVCHENVHRYTSSLHVYITTINANYLQKWKWTLKYVVKNNMQISANHNNVFFSFTPLQRTFDTLRNHPSFYVFNHRGRVMFQSPDTEDFQQNQAAFTSNAPLKLRKLESQQR